MSKSLNRAFDSYINLSNHRPGNYFGVAPAKKPNCSPLKVQKRSLKRGKGDVSPHVRENNLTPRSRTANALRNTLIKQVLCREGCVRRLRDSCAEFNRVTAGMELPGSIDEWDAEVVIIQRGNKM